MQLVPQRLLANPNFSSLVFRDNCCIVHKVLKEEKAQKQSYLTAHAFSLVLSGEQKLVMDDGSVIALRANQLAWLPKGLYTVSDFPDQSQPFECMLFYLDEDLLQQFLSSYPLPKAPEAKQWMSGNAPASITSYLQSLLAVFAMPTPPAGLIQAKIMEFLFLVGEAHPELIFALYHRNRPRYGNLVSFMENHFDKPLKLEDYAFLTGRSLSSFRRDFQGAIGQVPGQWLRQKRLAKARQELDSGHVSVTEVAHSVGYENLSHFIRAFREEFGTSPKQYLLQHQRSALTGS